MKNNINEYDQIRKSLAVIRSLNEDVEVVNLKKGGLQQNSKEATKSGDEITFDGINTTGFINTQGNISDEVKSALTTAVGEFIKASGLLLDTIAIDVEDSRVIMRSETIKNPGVDSIKSIVFDTNDGDPKLEVISGVISLDSDLINLLQTITRTFSDNQIGRDNLISLTQSGT